MSDETKKASTEADVSEDKQGQTTSFKVEVQADASEEKKEVERPGSCCGSCS